jgi:hypothetical protein
MRVFLLISVTLSSVCSDVHAQNTQDSCSIYTRAVLDLIAYQETKGHSSLIYLDANESIMVDLINDKIDSKKVVLLTYDNRKSLYKQNGNKLTHTQIFPAKIESGRLVITLTPYHGQRRGKKYNLAVSDGYNVIYELNCETRRYELRKIEEWGI